MPIVKRKHPRKKVNLPIEIQSNGVTEEGILMEISEGGGTFKVKFNLNPHSIALLRLYSKNGLDSFSRHTPISIKLIYKMQTGSKGLSKYGFEFNSAIMEENGVRKIIENGSS